MTGDDSELIAGAIVIASLIVSGTLLLTTIIDWLVIWWFGK